jgi:hypothetical protein
MAFKTCPTCGHIWPEREAALADPDLTVIGYQADFRDLRAGLFLFNHTVPGCNTTLSITAEAFLDLYGGQIFTVNMHGSDECSEFCLYADNIEPCPVECECAYVREVLQVVRNWPKTGEMAARVPSSGTFLAVPAPHRGTASPI